MKDLKNKPLTRVVLFFIVFVILIMTPWWISLPIILILAIYLPLYLEVLFWGFLFDTLYSTRFSLPYTYTTVALVALTILVFVRDRIRT